MGIWNPQKILPAKSSAKLIALLVMCFVPPISSGAQSASDAYVSVQIQRLRAKDPNVRLSAVQALAQVGPEAKVAIPALIEVFTQDEDWNNRTNAASALTRMGPDAVPSLIEVLTKDSHTGTRGIAAEVLGNIGPEAKAAVPALIQAPKDAEGLVRTDAASALTHMGPDAVPSLIEVLTKDSHADTRSLAAS